MRAEISSLLFQPHHTLSSQGWRKITRELSAVAVTQGPAGVRGRLTVPVDVCGTGVPFPVAVCVSLIGVVVVGAVVTAVSHAISVIVILRWVVMEWTVVL